MASLLGFLDLGGHLVLLQRGPSALSLADDPAFTALISAGLGFHLLCSEHNFLSWRSLLSKRRSGLSCQLLIGAKLKASKACGSYRKYVPRDLHGVFE
jgi:hypothetical protein